MLDQMTGGAQRRDDDDGPRWRKGEGVAFLWVIWKQVPSVGYSRLDDCCGGHNGKSIQSSLGVRWGERKKKKEKVSKAESRSLYSATVQRPCRSSHSNYGTPIKPTSTQKYLQSPSRSCIFPANQHQAKASRQEGK